MPNLLDHERSKIIEIIEDGFDMQRFQDASVSTDLLLVPHTQQQKYRGVADRV